jgi:hypothetical protein
MASSKDSSSYSGASSEPANIGKQGLMRRRLQERAPPPLQVKSSKSIPIPLLSPLAIPLHAVSHVGEEEINIEAAAAGESSLIVHGGTNSSTNGWQHPALGPFSTDMACSFGAAFPILF